MDHWALEEAVAMYRQFLCCLEELQRLFFDQNRFGSDYRRVTEIFNRELLKAARASRSLPQLHNAETFRSDPFDLDLSQELEPLELTNDAGSNGPWRQSRRRKQGYQPNVDLGAQQQFNQRVTLRPELVEIENMIQRLRAFTIPSLRSVLRSNSSSSLLTSAPEQPPSPPSAKQPVAEQPSGVLSQRETKEVIELVLRFCELLKDVHPLDQILEIELQRQNDYTRNIEFSVGQLQSASETQEKELQNQIDSMSNHIDNSFRILSEKLSSNCTQLRLLSEQVTLRNLGLFSASSSSSSSSATLDASNRSVVSNLAERMAQAKSTIQETEKFVEEDKNIHHILRETNLVDSKRIKSFSSNEQLVLKANNGVDYVKDRKSKDIIVKSLPVNNLADLLTGPKFNSILHLQRTAIMCLTYFSSVRDFLEKIIICYCVAPPFVSDPTGTNASKVLDSKKPPRDLDWDSVRTQLQAPQRVRVIVLLQLWVSRFYNLHFYNQPENLNLLMSFLRYTVGMSGNAVYAKRLLDSLQSQALLAHQYDVECAAILMRHQQLPSLRPGVASVAPFINVLELPVAKIAQQMCLLEFELYSHLTFGQLMHQRWTKQQSDQMQEESVIGVLCKNFNAVSNWVVVSILRQSDIETRASIVRRFIVLALHCLKWQNYNTVFEILSGLENSSVARLRMTWKNVGDELIRIMRRLQTIMTRNLVIMRHLWQICTPPSIPYVGMFLTDLTFIEEANPTFLKESNDDESSGSKSNPKAAGGRNSSERSGGLGSPLINMKKFFKISDCISSCLQSVSFPYHFDKIPAILDSLVKLPPIMDPQKAFEISCDHEPQKFTRHVPVKKFDFSREPEEMQIAKLVALKSHTLLTVDDANIDAISLSLAPEDDYLPSEAIAAAMKTPSLYQFSASELDGINLNMRSATSGLPRKARKFRMKMYNDTFLGSEAVSWFIENVSGVSNVEEALHLGNLLINKQIIKHVTEEKNFRNKNYLYVFCSPHS